LQTILVPMYINDMGTGIGADVRRSTSYGPNAVMILATNTDARSVDFIQVHVHPPHCSSHSSQFQWGYGWL
jgi:hypothetical protein